MASDGQSNTVFGIILGMVLMFVIYFSYMMARKPRKRMHRHVDGDGQVVYLDPVDGFHDCNCGGGYEFVRGDDGGDGDGGDGDGGDGDGGDGDGGGDGGGGGD